MIPNIHMYEHLMLERRKSLQREAERERWLSDLPHHSRLRQMIGRLGMFFVAIGTSMQQLEQRDQSIGA